MTKDTNNLDSPILDTNKKPNFYSIQTILALSKDEFDAKNDNAKGINIVKKTKDGDSLYILITFSGKIFEKANADGWKQTYPVK